MHTQNHKACLRNGSGIGSSIIITRDGGTPDGIGSSSSIDDEDTDEASATDDKERADKTKRVAKQPPWWQYKLFCLYSAYFLLGHGLGILGPTIVDLEELFQVDTGTISLVFTATGVGLLAGSAMCGILFDRFNYEFQFFLGLLILGTTVAAAPWTKHVGGYIALSTVNTIAGGYIDTAGQVYILYLCAGHKYNKSFMQGLLSMWSLGNAIVPLVVQPFLSTRTSNSNSSVTTSLNGHSYNQTSDMTENINDSSPTENNTIFVDIHNDGTAQSVTAESEGVKYAYLLVGSMVCMSSLFYIIAWCHGPKFCLRSRSQSKKSSEKKQQKRLTYVLTCLTILFFWFFFEAWVETCLSDCAMLFAVKGLHWSKQEGAWVASAMWISQLAGQLASVPVASLLSPRTMVYSTALGVTLGSAILQFVRLHGSFYWIGITLNGLALSLGFGAMVLWAHSYILVTGACASVFMVGAAAGAMLGPFVIGQLFDVYSAFVTIYIVLGGAVMLLIVTLVFECFIRYFPRAIVRQNENGLKSEERTALQKA